MSPEPREPLRIACPCCQAEITVDAVTGTVLSHRAKKEPIAGGRDFDALLQGLDAEKARAADVFEREVAAFKDRDRLLEERFKEALRRAEEDPDEGPPRRPFDLD